MSAPTAYSQTTAPPVKTVLFSRAPTAIPSRLSASGKSSSKTTSALSIATKSARRATRPGLITTNAQTFMRGSKRRMRPQERSAIPAGKGQALPQLHQKERAQGDVLGHRRFMTVQLPRSSV